MRERERWDGSEVGRKKGVRWRWFSGPATVSGGSRRRELERVNERDGGSGAGGCDLKAEMGKNGGDGNERGLRCGVRDMMGIWTFVQNGLGSGRVLDMVQGSGPGVAEGNCPEN